MNLRDKAWEKFLNSGAVSDYLHYRRICSLGLDVETAEEFLPEMDEESEIEDEGQYRCFGNQGTTHRGE